MEQVQYEDNVDEKPRKKKKKNKNKNKIESKSTAVAVREEIKPPSLKGLRKKVAKASKKMKSNKNGDIAPYTLMDYKDGKVAFGKDREELEIGSSEFIMNPISATHVAALWKKEYNKKGDILRKKGEKPVKEVRASVVMSDEEFDVDDLPMPEQGEFYYSESFEVTLKDTESGDEYSFTGRNGSALRGLKSSFGHILDTMPEDAIVENEDGEETFQKIPLVTVDAKSFYSDNYATDVYYPEFDLIEWVDVKDYKNMLDEETKMLFKSPVR